MPVTFGGMASGLNTDDIIKKLVDVEARPIQQWEEDKAVYSGKKEALNNLRSNLDRLNQSLRELYGFRATYSDKKAFSSDNGVVEVVAGKLAQAGVRSIEVNELASIHKISSDPINSETKLPAGKFKIEVNNVSKSVRFKGGDLKSLQDAIEAEASDIVSTSYINVTDNQYILTLESRTSGKKGEMKISGEKDLLYGSGLIKGVKGQEKQKTAMVFDGKYFVPYSGKIPEGPENGSIDVDKSGKFMTVTGKLWREYVLPMETEVKKSTVLEFSLDYTPPETEKEEALPYRLEVGPEEKTVIKGIELKSYNPSRIRPLEKKETKKDAGDVIGIGIISGTGDARVEKIYPIDKKFKGKMEIPIGRDFDGKKIGQIVFYCNDGTGRFADASIFTPVEDTGLLEPKNEVAKAGDARLKVDGVEVQRDKNEGLTDVIKGLTLNLRGKSEKPVSIKIEADVTKATEKIKAFVDAYNKYLDYNRELTKVEKSEKPGEYKKNRFKNGLFVGDMTILRLENSLKESVSSAYPGRSEKPIKLITQMGISTGAINAAWESIRQGKLVVDESALNAAIKDNPEAVEEFFGSDTDGDNRTDNGMAYRMESLLKPYVGSGKNIIASKIDFEENAIKTTNERIERHQEHLKKYEEKLRKKFATMEQSISGAKSQQSWMKNQMKGMEGGE